jgi:hypothetical protein
MRGPTAKKMEGAARKRGLTGGGARVRHRLRDKRIFDLGVDLWQQRSGAGF